MCRAFRHERALLLHHLCGKHNPAAARTKRVVHELELDYNMVAALHLLIDPPEAVRTAAQVATDTRLWLVSMVRTLRAALQELIAAAVQRAEAEADVLMPGYTHLQPAMTVRWSHWLLSHAAAWQRDDMRLRDLQPRIATLPLGSGVLAAWHRQGAVVEERFGATLLCPDQSARRSCMGCASLTCT